MDWTVFRASRLLGFVAPRARVVPCRGHQPPTDGDATVYVAAYGVFIAAAVASMSSDPVQEKMRRGGDGGGTFGLGSRDAVTLTVTRVTIAGPRSHLRHATTGVHNRVSTTQIGHICTPPPTSSEQAPDIQAGISHFLGQR